VRPSFSFAGFPSRLLARSRRAEQHASEPSPAGADRDARRPCALNQSPHATRGAHPQPCARGAHGIIFLTTGQPSTVDLFNIPSSPQQGLYWLLWRPPATSRRPLPVHRGHLISVSSTMQLRPWQTTTMFQSFRLHAQAKCYLQLNIFMAPHVCSTLPIPPPRHARGLGLSNT
jgi:hypothetical protein